MIITYQNSGNHRLSITPKQATRFEEANVWPRDERGYFTGVHFGLHHGSSDLSNDDVEALLDGQEVRGVVAT